MVEARPAFRGVMENGQRLFVTWMDSESNEMKFIDDFKRINAYFDTYDEVTEFSFENHIGIVHPASNNELNVIYRAKFPHLA